MSLLPLPQDQGSRPQHSVFLFSWTTIKHFHCTCYLGQEEVYRGYNSRPDERVVGTRPQCHRPLPDNLIHFPQKFEQKEETIKSKGNLLINISEPLTSRIRVHRVHN